MPTVTGPPMMTEPARVSNATRTGRLAVPYRATRPTEVKTGMSVTVLAPKACRDPRVATVNRVSRDAAAVTLLAPSV